MKKNEMRILDKIVKVLEFTIIVSSGVVGGLMFEKVLDQVLIKNNK